MQDPPPTPIAAAARPPRGRLAAGGSLFLLGVVCPVFVPLVAFAPIPVGWKAAISAGLLVGIPELLMLAAAAILGKPGFAYVAGRSKAGLRRLFGR